MESLKITQYKTVLIVILIITLLLTSCNSQSSAERGEASRRAPQGYIPQGEYPGCLDDVAPLDGEWQSSSDVLASRVNYDVIKGAWISYLNLDVKGMDGQAYSSYIDDMFEKLSQYGINTVFFQVRPYGDALYKSDIFPYSHILTGRQGEDPGYDPLSIAVEKAHQHKLSIHAWINPYRVQTSNGEDSTPDELSDDNPAVKADGDQTVLSMDDKLWYNPASEKASKLIIDGVYEIITRYDVDGIQFDDYFYPSTDSAIDSRSYEQYKTDGGNLELDEWRRDNVSAMIKALYSKIKRYDKNLVFGVSPSADINKNMTELYADVKLWTSESGYIDYICPQIYFGFKNSSLPFEDTLKSWMTLVKNSQVKLCVGLAGYKTGEHDKYAGLGEQEWMDNSDILARQAKLTLEDKKLYGVCVFDCDFIIGECGKIRQKEREELKDYLSKK